MVLTCQQEERSDQEANATQHTVSTWDMCAWDICAWDIHAVCTKILKCYIRAYRGNNRQFINVDVWASVGVGVGV